MSSLLRVFSSPHCIYKVSVVSSHRSPDNEAAAGSHRYVPLSRHALATRLALFLWASLSDERLLELAGRDGLRDPGVLAREAGRMLKDQRARSLVIDFAGQLWDFSEFGSFNNRDENRFPEFASKLRSAMAQEVEAFLTDLFQNDRPLTNILQADYTYANELLAKHYALKYRRHPVAETKNPAAGSHRYVRVPAGRGGLPMMGLFLRKNSLPLRTSPVQRGVWVMENLLARYLPNSPADVPSLSEDDSNHAGENIRQQLERHRAQSS
ncbi:MAG: DUF1592 domain-containing protein [Planctomycetota bacterium]